MCRALLCLSVLWWFMALWLQLCTFCAARSVGMHASHSLLPLLVAFDLWLGKEEEVVCKAAKGIWLWTWLRRQRLGGESNFVNQEECASSLKQIIKCPKNWLDPVRNVLQNLLTQQLLCQMILPLQSVVQTQTVSQSKVGFTFSKRNLRKNNSSKAREHFKCVIDIMQFFQT